jgi:magnesium chelatase family protein
VLAKVNSCSVEGIEGLLVAVEVDISGGLPVFNIVGLPDIAVRESKDRVKTAIKNSGYAFPIDRVIVNLAPADIKKDGTGLDLPMALGVLAASGIISPDKLNGWLFSGELSLDGEIRPVRGVLPFALAARDNGLKGLFIPSENVDEAAMVEGIDIRPAKSLSQIVDFFSGIFDIQPYNRESVWEQISEAKADDLDFSEVKGQFNVKRALEIVAAGSHNLLMTGPPGSGKSMLAKRIPTILPKMSFPEAIEVARIYSVLGMFELRKGFSLIRPFRAPHHSISDAGLVGGGSRPVPGEISLAHNGVLFLDELPEFRRSALEVLRQPIEDGQVHIARVGMKVIFPSVFMLVTAMNPCPCGYLSDVNGKCTCTLPQIQRYRARISGPLLDRMDIQIEVPKVPYRELGEKKEGESSSAIRKRVEQARAVQAERFTGTNIFSNSRMTGRYINSCCRLDSESDRILEKSVDYLGFSARACYSVIRVARTIADLDGSTEIKRQHITEAVQLRSFDRG